MFFAEDLSNLTASDVMNRVNLGYLQGALRVDPGIIVLLLPKGDRSLPDEQSDHQNTLSYVLINPSPDTRLELNDVV